MAAMAPALLFPIGDNTHLRITPMIFHLAPIIQEESLVPLDERYIGERSVAPQALVRQR